jgi:hypothetical protein
MFAKDNLTQVTSTMDCSANIELNVDKFRRDCPRGPLFLISSVVYYGNMVSQSDMLREAVILVCEPNKLDL